MTEGHSVRFTTVSSNDLSSCHLALATTQHLCLFQGLNVSSTCTRYHNWAVRQKPVPSRLIACANSSKLQRDNLVVEQCHYPAYWPNKGFCSGPPIHRLGPTQLLQLCGEVFNQYIGGKTTTGFGLCA